MADTERTGPRHRNRPDTTTEPSVTARAYAGPPCCGRTLWAITVLSCPACGGMHQHRAGLAARLLAGRVERACPVTGQAYVLRPVQRRREARRG